MVFWDKSELNSEQEHAILEDDSILLIACPGSGKTRTLSYKIAYELLKLKSRRQFLIGITYTNAAADEIKERIEILGADTKQLWIGTIHSFCLEWILKPYYLYLAGLKNGFTIIDSHESEDLLTAICQRQRNGISYWDCNTIATPNGIRLTSLDKNKHPDIWKAINEYHRTLKANRQIDFEQILMYSLELLTNHEVIATTLSQIFPRILIDEYQDTKEIQYHIIGSILKAGRGNCKTFVVGDPNQSIYQSLGGFPMKKTMLENLFGLSLKKLTLSLNYRSSAKIISFFKAFATDKSPIKASGKFVEYKSEIVHRTNIQASHIDQELVKLIKRSVAKGISPNEICIVAPQWLHLASLTRTLMIKMPDFSFNGPGMAPFSRDIENFWYKLSRIVLTEPSPDAYVRRVRWSKEILLEMASAGVDVSKLNAKSFLTICNSIQCRQTAGLDYLAAFFSTLFKHLNCDIKNYKILYEHYAAFFRSSTARIERLKTAGNTSIDTIESFRNVFRQKDGITISTMHGVKGAEYEVVVAFGLLEGFVPHFKDPSGQENAKKMLYVIGSRAKKNLYLISETGRSVNRHNPNGMQPTGQLLSAEYRFDEMK
jgi:DNA helicase II / ATP-dependent DNA helicase PcrA